jgi:hypothetical protein
MFEVVRNNLVISRHKTRSAAEKNMNRLMKKESSDQSAKNELYGFIGWEYRISTTGVYCVREAR